MKSTLFKTIVITAIFMSLYSCSSSDDSSGGRSNVGYNGSTSALGGSYNVVSMVSDISVDLNNDGITSTDLFNEIDPSFFSNIPELEIKPIVYNNKLEDIMSFYLPHGSVVVSTPSTPGSAKFTRNGLGYVFEYDKNTQNISIENNDTSPDPAVYGSMQAVTVLGPGKIKAVFKKYFYDFSSVEWQLLTITCVYTKI